MAAEPPLPGREEVSLALVSTNRKSQVASSNRWSLMDSSFRARFPSVALTGSTQEPANGSRLPPRWVRSKSRDRLDEVKDASPRHGALHQDHKREGNDSGSFDTHLDLYGRTSCVLA